MDEFVLTIDKDKFRSTNAKWNELMLNDPWSVGYVSTLIEAANWKNKEEWEETIQKAILWVENALSLFPDDKYYQDTLEKLLEFKEKTNVN